MEKIAVIEIEALNTDGSESAFHIDSVHTVFHPSKCGLLGETDSFGINMNMEQYAEFMRVVFGAGIHCFGQDVLDEFNSKFGTEVLSMVEKECLSDG